MWHAVISPLLVGFAQAEACALSLTLNGPHILWRNDRWKRPLKASILVTIARLISDLAATSSAVMLAASRKLQSFTAISRLAAFAFYRP